MELGKGIPFSELKEEAFCPDCDAGCRLTGGLCLNCILEGALDDCDVASAEAFEEALSAIEGSPDIRRIGGHEILEEIARGGMGVVYRAREPHSARIVALKCILLHQGDRADAKPARSWREAEIAARLDHPNIVPVYQIGETADGCPFFTMKYVGGGSLLQARAAFQQKPRDSVVLVKKIARALQHAHEHGVLHRDLKPGNILLADHQEPLVTDFGLARCHHITSDLTRSFTSFGTPGYMAPEQADGPSVKLTATTDIYALGAILFELLAGRLPFVGDNVLGVIKQSAVTPAPKLRSIAPQLDRDLETICARCLERDPSARYPSAANLADDLDRWLEGDSITARPIGTWIRLRRWVRANRTKCVLLSAVCILTAALVGWESHNRTLERAFSVNSLASRSVAVLPLLDLDNVIPDPSLAQSIASSLQSDLDRFAPSAVKTPEARIDLIVPENIPRIALMTKARFLITGTVRSSRNGKRVSLKIVEAGTGEALFAVTYDAPGQEDQNLSTTISHDLSRRVNDILETKDLSDIIEAQIDPGLRNNSARENILAGRELMLHANSVSDENRAIDLIQKGLLAEPNSAMGHAYLSSLWTGRSYQTGDLSFLKIGKSEADKAISLSPLLSDAHRARAAVYYAEGRYSEAREEQLRTIEVGGLDERTAMFVAMTLDAVGKPHQALKWCALVSKMKHIPGDVEAMIGWCWRQLADDGQAVKAFERAMELHPDSADGSRGVSSIRLLNSDFAGARSLWRSKRPGKTGGNDPDWLLAQIEFFARNYETAGQMYAMLSSVEPQGGCPFGSIVSYQSALARIKESAGDHKESKAILRECLNQETAAFNREPENPKAAYRLAAVEAGLGMVESSFHHLRQAIALGWLDYRSLDLDPRFDSLRPSPEFRTIKGEISAKVADLRAQAKEIIP